MIYVGHRYRWAENDPKSVLAHPVDDVGNIIVFWNDPNRDDNEVLVKDFGADPLYPVHIPTLFIKVIAKCVPNKAIVYE